MSPVSASIGRDLLKRIVKLYRQSPLLKKMTLMMAIMLLVPCALLSAFLFNMEMRRHVEREIARNEAVLHAMANDIRNQMTYVESVIDLMAESPALRDVLGTAPQTYSDLVVTLLFDVRAEIEDNTAYLREMDASIMLIPMNEGIPEVYSSVMRHGSMLEDESYARFIAEDEYAMWGDVGYFMPPGRRNANYYTAQKLPYYKSINAAFMQRLGTIKCSVSTARLFESLMPWNGAEALRVYQGGQCVWAAGGDEGALLSSGIQPAAWREGNALHLPVDVGHADLTLVLEMNYRNARWQAAASILPFALLVPGAFVVIVLVTRALLNAILRRLQMTVAAMGHVSEGNTHVQLPEGDHDEIGMLISAFNALLRQINRQHEEVLDKEVSRQKAQVLALQYQMNPHFLFNSLNWLQLQAEMGARNEDLSNAIALLGNVLHYSLSSQPYATVGMEIAHIRGYVAFVCLWKRTDIALEVRCGEAAQALVIPRFTLQPLVENAVWHGLAPNGNLAVSIAIEEALGNMRITVENDGRPVSPAQLSDMRGRVSPQGAQRDEGGMGLRNLARRLYLLYGQEASITIEAQDGKPRITLCFPARAQEAMQAWIF